MYLPKSGKAYPTRAPLFVLLYGLTIFNAHVAVAPDSTSAAECECRSEGEKEQLSPVSVMDFPSEDDEDEDEETTSASFRRSLAGIEKTKHHLMQKIRRFESLAELDPVELDRRFTSFEKGEEDEEEVSHATEPSDRVASDVDDGEDATDEWKAWALLGQLKAASAVGPSSENLLLDFFIERLSSDGVNHAVPSVWRAYTRPSDGAREAEVLQTARDWVSGSGPKGEWDCLGDGATLTDTDWSGRWRFFQEEAELSVELEEFVLRSLVHELVLDLVS